MKITVLGCGGAGGVPMLSVGWGNCDPENPRNRRRRTSILIEQGETRILVDTSPDLRSQLLDVGVNRLSAVLYTHDHADHVHGIDDLREINRVMGVPLDCWGTARTLEAIQGRFGYVFSSLDTDVVPIYKPMLMPRTFDGPFQVDGLEIRPFEQDHGWGTKSTGFRIGDFAYSTDVVELPEESFAVLAGVKLWVIGCLTDMPHQTHAHVDKVLAWVERVKPQRAVLTHMSPKLDYDRLRAQLPGHVEPAYDGMVLDA